jgi:hypothetical protein
MAGVHDPRDELIAAVEREIAELEAADDVTSDLEQRARRGNGGSAGSSVVFSMRLDPGELAALHKRAAVLRVKPSVLARNLVRAGLQTSRDRAVSEAVGRADLAIQDLRAVLE